MATAEAAGAEFDQAIARWEAAGCPCGSESAEYRAHNAASDRYWDVRDALNSAKFSYYDELLSAAEDECDELRAQNSSLRNELACLREHQKLFAREHENARRMAHLYRSHLEMLGEM